MLSPPNSNGLGMTTNSKGLAPNLKNFVVIHVISYPYKLNIKLTGQSSAIPNRQGIMHKYFRNNINFYLNKEDFIQHQGI